VAGLSDYHRPENQLAETAYPYQQTVIQAYFTESLKCCVPIQWLRGKVKLRHEPSVIDQSAILHYILNILHNFYFIFITIQIHETGINTKE
jgi:hypothetical protein